MIRALLLLLALGCGLAGAARAETPTARPAAHPDAVSAGQAQQTLDILRDDKKRAALIGTLETIARAQPQPAGGTLALPLEPGSVAAQTFGAFSRFLRNLSVQSQALFAAVARTPELWRGMADLSRDPAQRTLLLDALWRLVAVMACGIAVEWLLQRAIRRPTRGLHGLAPGGTADAAEYEPVPQPATDEEPEPEPPHRVRANAWTLLRRVPLAIGRLLLDLLPVCGFLLTAQLLIASPLGGNGLLRSVQVVVAEGYATCRALLCLARMMLSPDSARLRLIQVSDQGAAYIMRWLRRLIAVAVLGYALAQAGLLLGMSEAAHEAALKGVGLAVHVMLIIVVLQKREPVRRRLQAPKRAHGFTAALRDKFAARWHWIALFYLVAIWLVWAVELPHGFTRLLHFAATTTAVLLLGRLALIVALGLLDRAAPSAETTAGHPGLDQRVQAYRPVLRAVARGLIYAIVALVLLQVWGFGTLTWLSFSTPGRRLLGSLASIAVTVVVALLVWEASNAAIRGHLERLAAEQQAARSARLRTLLPLLRTTLLVAILIVAGLIVLSNLGLNIAPLLAGAGVLGIAIGFGSQKLVQDVITGLFLLIENTVQVGDVVSLASVAGVVEHLSIRSIRLRAEDGSVHVIPFSGVTTVTNMTRDFAYAVINASVAYQDDYDAVVAVLSEIVKEMREEPRWAGEILDDLEVWGLDKFAESAIIVKVRIRCGPFARWSVMREFNRRMKMKFNEHGIQIPYPHQQLIIDQPIRLDHKPPVAPASPAVPAERAAE